MQLTKHKTLLILGAALSLLVFLVFTVVVKFDLFSVFDFDTTERIQNNVPKTVDTILSYLSLIGSVEITTLFLIGMLAVYRLFVPGLIVFFTYSVAHVIEIIGKTFLQHPGPPHLFFRYDLGFTFPSTYVQPGSSYPSGHSLRVVFLAVIILVLLMRTTKRFGFRESLLTAFVLLFVGAMLVSRVSLGEHWPSDVIGGALLGLSCGLFSGVFIMRDRKLPAQNGEPHKLPRQNRG